MSAPAAGAAAAWAAPPAQQTLQPGAPLGAGVHIRSLKREDLQTETIREVGSLLHDGFGEKRCCVCVKTPESELQAHLLKAYSQFPDAKLEACGVAFDGDGHALGLVQLGFHDTPGDFEMPLIMQEQVRQDTCHVERIAVGAKARGQGVGQKLLGWADGKARERSCRFMELEVVKGNPAKRLYERTGYVTTSGRCGRWAMCPVIFCLIGYLYVDVMRKPLHGPAC